LAIILLNLPEQETNVTPLGVMTEGSLQKDIGAMVFILLTKTDNYRRLTHYRRAMPFGNIKKGSFEFSFVTI